VARRYFFEGFCLDQDRTRLLGPNGEKVKVKPTAYRVLERLVVDAPHTVSKEKLFESVWKGDTTDKQYLVKRLDQAIHQIRSKLSHAFIETLPRLGFAFGPKVTRDESDTIQIAGLEPSSVSGGPLVLSTKRSNPQWADFANYLAPPVPWCLRCRFSTNSEYFRFGFKLLCKSIPVFTHTWSIQSDDESLIVHVGRNYWDRPGITKRDLFIHTDVNGRRLDADRRLQRTVKAMTAQIELTIDNAYFARLLVDGVLQFSQAVPAEICDRVVILAWGDDDEYRVDVTEMSLKTIRKV
jgi:DNA-binding winged helix-turn-helix (wHTH) protein